MELELECLWNNDETDIMNELGLPNNIEAYSTREVTFYRIDVISPNLAFNIPFTDVTVGGDSWVCIDDYETVKNKIKKANQ